MNERRRLVSTLALALSIASVASAQTAPAPAPAAAPEPVPASPAPATAPAPRELAHADTTGLRPISSSEALKRAMQNSPALRLAEIDLKSAQADVQGEEGRYPYYFGANAGYTRGVSTQLRSNDTVSSSSSHSVTAGVGLSRQFRTGTSAEVRADGEYFHNDSPSSAAGVTPFAASGYGASFRASVMQPLLRGYGTRVGEAELRAARVARTASEKGLLRTRSALIGDVLSAYLELWYASRAVDIETSSLALAREQLDQASARLSLGNISKVDLLSFQTRASELEESLISAELGRQQRSVALSQLMGQAPPDPDLFASTEPSFEGRRFELHEVETAMRADSIELAELEEQVKLARTQAEIAGESWRPRLDVEAWAQSTGVSTEFPNAWGRAASGQYWSAHAGIALDLPLDDAGRHAEQMRAALRVQAAQQQLEAARRQVGANASTAIANERAARERLTSAQRTTTIAEETYNAERERYELGQALVISVQEAEAALRRARLREARARVDAAQARLVLLHLTGGLLSGAGTSAAPTGD